ncbi:MAG: hypothetical protein H6821_06745 [Planctomycetaceae bacterium]|nr:hypothetical protein [Planctomycetaceae bacterium]MCB9941470.1 hypothetical protein [Planctomycetaceae bacterium]
MEARLSRAALVVAVFLSSCAVSLGASHRTENFIVTAPTQQLAQDVAETAESMRRDLAIEWLGHELGPWQDVCPITVNVGTHLGAGGATSFMFENGRPFGWTMSIQGSRERILDSVLPHEITHTIFATHFGRPLPRWADEGACTTVEDISERQKQHNMLYEFLTTHRGIAFNEMFAMTEYPSDVLPLYSQGYSLARYFIAQGGKRKFVEYVGDGMKWNNWTRATQQHYGYRSLSDLQVTWLDWVRRGSPALPAQQTLVAQEQPPAEAALVAVAAEDTQQTAPITQLASATITEATSTEEDLSSTAGGWYSRVRDETIASRNNVKQASFSNEATIATPATEVATASQTVSRPQPVGRPGQIILEWSRPATASQNQAAPTPQHRLIPGFRGTLWR